MDKMNPETSTQPTAYNSSTKRIAKNTLMLYFRQILIMLVSLYTVRVVLATLGAEDYGINNVVAGVVTMFGFLNGAMASASQRYFSFDLGKKDYEHLKKTFSLTVTIYLIVAVVIVILAETVGLWFVYNKLVIPVERVKAARWIYQFSIISFIFTIMTAPFMSAIIAHENMDIYAYVSIIEVVLKLVVAFLIRVFTVDKLWLYGFLMLLVTILNTTIYRAVCKIKYSECKYKFYWDKNYAKEMASFVGWNLFGSMVGTFKDQFVNILLNQFFNPIVNAARGIAINVNSAVSSFSQNFSTALKPQIIKSFASGDTDDSIKLTFRGCKFTYYLMWIFTLPLVFEMDFVLTVWLKNPPENCILFTRLTLIDCLITSISFPIMTLCQATGKIKLYQSFVGTLLLLNFPVSWIALKLGCPAYSVFIVAVVISFISLIARVVIVRKIISFSIRLFFVDVILPALLTTVLSSGIAFTVYKLMPSGILFSFIKIAIDVLFVCVFAVFVGLNKNERNYIFNIIKSKICKRGR